MNEVQPNFSRNRTLKSEYCVKSCGEEIDYEHFTWCSIINTKKEYKYTHLLNGTLREKI